LFKSIIEIEKDIPKPCIPFIYKSKKDGHIYARFITLMLVNYEQRFYEIMILIKSVEIRCFLNFKLQKKNQQIMFIFFIDTKNIAN